MHLGERAGCRLQASGGGGGQVRETKSARRPGRSARFGPTDGAASDAKVARRSRSWPGNGRQWLRGAWLNQASLSLVRMSLCSPYAAAARRLAVLFVCDGCEEPESCSSDWRPRSGVSGPDAGGCENGACLTATAPANAESACARACLRACEAALHDAYTRCCSAVLQLGPHQRSSTSEVNHGSRLARLSAPHHDHHHPPPRPPVIFIGPGLPIYRLEPRHVRTRVWLSLLCHLMPVER